MKGFLLPGDNQFPMQICKFLVWVGSEVWQGQVICNKRGEDAEEEFGYNIRGGNKNCIFVSEEGDVGSMIMENHEEMVEESHDQNIL